MRSSRKILGIRFLKHLLVTSFGYDLGTQVFLMARTRQWSLNPINIGDSEKFCGLFVENRSIEEERCVIRVG